MKVNIIKEKKNHYFATMPGELGIHAVGETPELALEYFIDVYNETMVLRKEVVKKKIKLLNLKKSPLLNLGFKSLQLSL